MHGADRRTGGDEADERMADGAHEARIGRTGKRGMDGAEEAQMGPRRRKWGLVGADERTSRWAWV